jgi:hypothetical protein
MESLNLGARSWGADIESLLTNQIESVIIQCSKFKEFIRKKSLRIGALTAILFSISSLVGLYISNSLFNQNEIERVTKFIKTNPEINGKIDFLLNHVAANGYNSFSLKSALFGVVSIFIAVILGIWVESLADNKTRSYLVLTREAKKQRDILTIKSKKQYYMFWVSILVSIITGIIANYIFNYLT